MTVEQAMELDRQRAEAQAGQDSTIQDLIDHLTYCDDVACDCGEAPDFLS